MYPQEKPKNITSRLFLKTHPFLSIISIKYNSKSGDLKRLKPDFKFTLSSCK